MRGEGPDDWFEVFEGGVSVESQIGNCDADCQSFGGKDWPRVSATFIHAVSETQGMESTRSTSSL